MADSISKSQLAKLRASRKIVVKIGSAAIIDKQHGINQAGMDAIARQITQLHQSGYKILLVSSGAVAAGRRLLQVRAQDLNAYQACAALGQSLINQAWLQAFNQHGGNSAQILLTHADMSDRLRYLNARATLNSLLDFNLIPVLNENDAVSIGEARFGNNDLLAAYVSNLVEAQLMLLLTDQQGLYQADPRHNPQAQLIKAISIEDPRLENIAGANSGSLGTGGMASKIQAARIAARSGTLVVISSSQEANSLVNIASGQISGSLLHSSQGTLAARKRWLTSLRVKGRVCIDAGAAAALRAKRSLLAIGVVSISGDFARGELIACVSEQGEQIALGLTNYPANELERIKRLPSSAISTTLGHHYGAEVIHRDNLALEAG